jgi:Xaa-Pro aminopeptidase
MEDLGEDFVGYDHTVERSSQFGLAYLRLAKKLEPGHVLTVEPGIYFIPALIDQWSAENKFSQFIDYRKVEQYRDFGGIRIEDNVLVTQDGRQVLGKGIPKTVEEVEEITATG